jgi:hypothetical protein
MNDGQRVPARRDIFKVAPRLRMPNFYYYDIRCRAQHLNRETLGRLEQRAIDSSSAVSNVQNLYVNAGAGCLGKDDGGKMRQHQHCKQCYVPCADFYYVFGT